MKAKKFRYGNWSESLTDNELKRITGGYGIYMCIYSDCNFPPCLTSYVGSCSDCDSFMSSTCASNAAFSYCG